jgi:hypothetical protein
MVKTGDQRAAAAAKRKGAPSPGGTGGGGGTMPELKSSVVDKDTTAASAAGAGAGGDKIEEMQAGPGLATASSFLLNGNRGAFVRATTRGIPPRKRM